MRMVAEHLKLHAIAATSAEEINFFGRSAYNRYYYSCYWIIRTELFEMFDNWEKTGHATIPEKLKTSIKEKIFKQCDKLVKTGIFNQADSEKKKRLAQYLIRDISVTMKKGYNHRCVADYNPERKAILKDHHIYLDGLNIAEIEKWERDLRSKAMQLKSLWNGIGLS